MHTAEVSAAEKTQVNVLPCYEKDFKKNEHESGCYSLKTNSFEKFPMKLMQITLHNILQQIFLHFSQARNKIADLQAYI